MAWGISLWSQLLSVESLTLPQLVSASMALELRGGGLLVGQLEGRAGGLSCHPGVLLKAGCFLTTSPILLYLQAERKDSHLWALHTQARTNARPTPCHLFVESASAGASHHSFSPAIFLSFMVFFRFQNSPAFPNWDSPTPQLVYPCLFLWVSSLQTWLGIRIA